MAQVQQRLAAFEGHAAPGQPLPHLIPTAQQQMPGRGERTQVLMSTRGKQDPAEMESSRVGSNPGSSRQEKTLLGKKDGAREQPG